MEVRKYSVFTFEELPEDIQERALDNLRDINVDYEWWESTLYYYKEKLEKAGFKNTEISFSGFGSQGDGASFVADCDNREVLNSLFLDNEGQIAWLNKKGLTDKANEEYKQWRLWLTMDYNNGSINFSIKRNSSWYSYENTISPSVEIDSDYQDNGVWNNGVWESVFMNKVNQEKLETMFEEYVMCWCRKIYKGLEEEYEYLTSDDCVRETILANEYFFTEDGAID